MSLYDHIPFCPVSDCRPRLRRMLETGGMVSWFDGKVTRVLWHDAAFHCPPRRLPWPLSILQPHLIEFSIYAGEDDWARPGSQPIHRHLYKKSQVESAIEEFLRGAPADHIIIFTDR